MVREVNRCDEFVSTRTADLSHPEQPIAALPASLPPSWPSTAVCATCASECCQVVIPAPRDQPYERTVWGRLAGNRAQTYLADLIFGHTSTHITLVLEDQQRGTHQTLREVVSDPADLASGKSKKGSYLLNQESLQFLPAIVQALAVRGIHHPYERVGLFEVVLPVCAEGLLAAHVPFGQISYRDRSGQSK